MKQDPISLYELNYVVKGIISESLNQLIWIKAELSDVKINRNGHCYLEFIEKDSRNQNIIAKARGSIWANSFKLIKSYFETETGQSFVSGIKVLVQVKVEFHELYGYSLNVQNIDPTYTLGDQAKNRASILKRLEDDGVLYLNKELVLPQIINRIAIISSATAAGYEDFCNQLANNQNGFTFYYHLFPAIMQGEKTESSIINALENIYENAEYFDIVVIIRGGGATSDLSSFDSYQLATNCAQFPLPIITGIGHERDDTILDIVAHSRAKTPTAVAEFIIDRMDTNANKIASLESLIINSSINCMGVQSNKLNILATKFTYLTTNKTKDQLIILKQKTEKLKVLTNNFIQKKSYDLANQEQFIKLSSPDNILKKGFSITMKGNQIIKSSVQLSKGDTIVSHFKDGDIQSVVE